MLLAVSCPRRLESGAGMVHAREPAGWTMAVLINGVLLPLHCKACLTNLQEQSLPFWSLSEQSAEISREVHQLACWCWGWIYPAGG